MRWGNWDLHANFSILGSELLHKSLKDALGPVLAPGSWLVHTEAGWGTEGQHLLPSVCSFHSVQTSSLSSSVYTVKYASLPCPATHVNATSLEILIPSSQDSQFCRIWVRCSVWANQRWLYRTKMTFQFSAKRHIRKPDVEDSWVEAGMGSYFANTYQACGWTCLISKQKMSRPSSHWPLQQPWLCPLIGFRMEKSRILGLDS